MGTATTQEGQMGRAARPTKFAAIAMAAHRKRGVLFLIHDPSSPDIPGVVSSYKFMGANVTGTLRMMCDAIKSEHGDVRIVLGDPMHQYGHYNPHGSFASKVAVALHWLGLAGDGIEAIAIADPDRLSAFDLNSQWLKDRLLYDCTEQPNLNPAIPHGAIAAGDRDWDRVRWDVPITPDVSDGIMFAARALAMKELKDALAELNSMLLEPDYSTAVTGDILEKGASVLELLSFGKATLDVGDGSGLYAGDVRCLPPEGFHDEMADEIRLAAGRISSLISVWNRYADNAPIEFSFPFSDVRGKVGLIQDIAKTIGIEHAVMAYLAGVPLEDI